MTMDITLKEKRVKVLEKIDKLIKKCDCFYIEDQENCSNCQTIRKLGDELISLVSDRAVIDKNGMKVFTSELTVNAIENKFLEEFPISKLEYLDMRKDLKLKDEQIMQRLDISKEDLEEFKKICGIIEDHGKIEDVKVNLKTMKTTQDFIDTFPLTKSKYLDMKNNQGMTDSDIMKATGIPQRQLTNWKRLVGILGQMRSKSKTIKESKEQQKIKRRTEKMKRYFELKESTSLSDDKIAERIGVAFSTLWRWKKELNIK